MPEFYVTTHTEVTGITAAELLPALQDVHLRAPDAVLVPNSDTGDIAIFVRGAYAGFIDMLDGHLDWAAD